MKCLLIGGSLDGQWKNIDDEAFEFIVGVIDRTEVLIETKLTPEIKREVYKRRIIQGLDGGRIHVFCLDSINYIQMFELLTLNYKPLK